MARICWTPEVALACQRATARVHASNGGLSRELAHGALDAMLLPDETAVVISADSVTWLKLDGTRRTRQPLELSEPRTAAAMPVPLTLASIAAEAGHFIGLTDRTAAVWTTAGRLIWQLSYHRFNLGDVELTSAAISARGKYAAIGYEARPYHNRDPGRGWIVVEVATNRLANQSWTSVVRSAGELVFAFDASERRLIHAMPEALDSIGAIRIDRDDQYRRTVPGGARAVALSDTGLVAAYAYPTVPEGARGRLRVDYLARHTRGPTMIDVLDTLSIEPDVAEIVALAIVGHDIACLGADGTVEVVPVP
jgi:hypothetical protein